MTRTADPLTCSSLLVHLRDSGDAAAWRTFVDSYTPLVYRFARRRGLQDADALDVVQQVFAQVSQAIARFDYDPQRGQFRGWLGTITARTISRHFKRKAQPGRAPGVGADEPAIEALASDADPAWKDEFQLQIRQVALERIRDEFDPLVWQAFELTWLEDQEPGQAAAALHKPAAWIYKARFKVLQRLKQEVQYLSADTAFFCNGH